MGKILIMDLDLCLHYVELSHGKRGLRVSRIELLLFLEAISKRSKKELFARK